MGAAWCLLLEPTHGLWPPLPLLHFPKCKSHTSNKNAACYQEIMQLVIAGSEITQLINSINDFNGGHFLDIGKRAPWRRFAVWLVCYFSLTLADLHERTQILGARQQSLEENLESLISFWTCRGWWGLRTCKMTGAGDSPAGRELLTEQEKGNF